MNFQRIKPLLLIFSILVTVFAEESSESYKVEEIPNSFAHLGEGPHWDPKTQNLYYVDLEQGKLKRYDYNLEKIFTCKVENAPFSTFIIPIEGSEDEFAVGMEHNVAVVQWDGFAETCKINRTILTVEDRDPKYDNNRFNDGKCDPLGRLFAGTMRKSDYDQRTGSLYKLLKVNSSEVMLSKVGISNGLAWNMEGNKFYYIDSQDYNVKEFDYDLNTGEISNGRVICDTKAMPDGMAIDTDGMLYVAGYGGEEIMKIDPSVSKIVLRIKIPAKYVSSAAFGGPSLDTLYVTTIKQKDPSKGAGKTFKVTGLGAIGVPMTKVNLQP